MHGSAVSSPQRKRVKLDGISRSYDARVRAIRADLADVALAEYYFAPHYASPVAHACAAPSVMLRAVPDETASAVTELLHGEVFFMLDARAGWAWGYCGHDHYVGYVPVDALGEPIDAAYVARARAPVFTRADIKSPVKTILPPGARLAGTMEDFFLVTGEEPPNGGYVHVRHLATIDTYETDWVAVAQRSVGEPYVWGGRGGLGMDCSGLVQTALAACGIAAPRDTDQQAQQLGEPLPDDAELRRGDIIFFPGHVGLMMDSEKLIHANAHWMAVTIEPLSDVIARLQDEHDQPVTGRRRISQ
ncbi:NlpC/P60 family protein [Sphingobium nicotianae]|uniref:C40 family peptidase n=1 Tax=Sphingobium nicotianae TaxID=2782607 RepID=A0A9X1DBJ8_9SPHN|nr:NlpC/P60 family protein [Sphingobium nicotianae]MBT2186894.1 C40 family peptidase [Sphingobium nicotianae]